MVGRQALEIEFLKGALKNAPRPRSATTSVIIGPPASPSPKVPTNGPVRSTFYDAVDARTNDAIVVADMIAICDEFEAMATGVLAPSSAIAAWSSTPRRFAG